MDERKKVTEWLGELYLYEEDLTTVIETLTDLREAHQNNYERLYITLETNNSGVMRDSDIVIYGERLETDQEMVSREIKLDQKRIQKRMELDELERARDRLAAELKALGG